MTIASLISQPCTKRLTKNLILNKGESVMKKLAMILLTFILAFGFSSMTFAGSDDGHKGDNNTTEKVTFHKGVTTIVKTTKEVSYDKVVKVEKDTDYKTEKKFKKDAYT